MKLTRIETPLATTAADALVIGLHADSKPSGASAEADRATGGLLSKLIERKEITGKRYELTPLLAPAGLAAEQLLILGLGPAEKYAPGIAHRAAASAAKLLAAKPRRRIAFFLDEVSAAITEAAVAGALVGCQSQDLYRAEKKRTPFGELLWSGGAAAAVANGEILGESINLTRRLVNESPDKMYPASFAAHAEEVAKACGLEIEVWDQKRLERERCGALLGVAQGSHREPRIVILRYRGGKSNAPLLGWIGKGVTFDSGGLSLKPSDSMLTMKCDMAGAATVLGAMQAVARLKLPVNVVGLAGLVENMTGPAAYKLGDVLTARSGKTIEIHNTDAEGRVVLADVLNVAIETGAAKLIDLATLTGACVVALGTEIAGLMTNDQSWCDAVSAAAATCGEGVWQLPMFPEFDEQILSDVADIKNVGEGRWGGAITAAKFLEQFVDKRPWTHIDIAGPAFAEKPKPWTDGGGSGALVRTLVEVARAFRG